MARVVHNANKNDKMLAIVENKSVAPSHFDAAERFDLQQMHRFQKHNTDHLMEQASRPVREERVVPVSYPVSGQVVYDRAYERPRMLTEIRHTTTTKPKYQYANRAESEILYDVAGSGSVASDRTPAARDARRRSSAAPIPQPLSTLRGLGEFVHMGRVSHRMTDFLANWVVGPGAQPTNRPKTVYYERADTTGSTDFESRHDQPAWQDM